MSKELYSILVNTTDSFEDCWFPFFTLFKNYWSDYKGRIYLNTETKEYSHTGLDIIPIKNNQKSWSDCLIFALQQIKEEYVLYLQDDYFIKDLVKNKLVDKYLILMIENNIDCLHLTDQHGPGPFHTCGISDLLEVDKKAKYRISCQAGLWKKSALLEYLLKGESGWNFEIYGTMRSRYINHFFCTIDRNIIKLDKYEIIPYIFTGIIYGKWKPEVVHLFEKNQISVDFSQRGFFAENIKTPIKKRIKNKLKNLPILLNTIWFISKKMIIGVTK